MSGGTRLLQTCWLFQFDGNDQVNFIQKLNSAFRSPWFENVSKIWWDGGGGSGNYFLSEDRWTVASFTSDRWFLAHESTFRKFRSVFFQVACTESLLLTTFAQGSLLSRGFAALSTRQSGTRVGGSDRSGWSSQLSSGHFLGDYCVITSPQGMWVC